MGTIKIEVANPKFRVVYDNNQRSDYISEYLDNKVQRKIRFKDVRFLKKQLFFTIKNFTLNKIKGFFGKIMIKIIIKTTDNKSIFNDIKTIQAKREQVDLKINFKWLKNNNYFLILEARDLSSNENIMFFSEILVK